LAKKIDRKPKVWIAVVLSFILIGLGHFYAQAWIRGSAWLISIFFLSILFTNAGVPFLITSIIAVLIAIICATDVAVIIKYGSWRKYFAK
jgi:hypothetical protein